jgi:hypothetical protein
VVTLALYAKSETKQLTMKKNKAWLFLSLLTAAVACQDDNEPANSISPEEAALIVASSLASNTSGVTSVSDKSADVAVDLVADNAGGRVEVCGVSQNLDLSGSSPDGAVVSYAYDFSYKFKLNCNSEDQPADVSVNLSYSGQFDAPKLAAEHTGLAELYVTGLEETETGFMLNGLYKRSGSFENKEKEQSGSSTVEITLTEVAVDKQTHKIISGSGTYALNGTVPAKGDFSYNGSIVFEGLDGAVIDVKGAKFNTNLKNGEITKVN